MILSVEKISVKEMKNIHFVALNSIILHDTTKVCFKWEREPADNIKDETVMNAFQHSEKYAYQAVEKYSKDICPKCLWLFEPYHGNRDIILDSLDINFEANDPILLSKFWFMRILHGRPDSTYNQEYGPILKINSSNIRDFLRELMHLPTPLAGDIEAVKILSEVTTFLQKWTDNDKVKILQINEY